AGDAAAELLDAVAQLLGVPQLFLDVGGQGLLDELGPDALQVQAVGQVVDDRLHLHVVRLAQTGDDLFLRDRHGVNSPWNRVSPGPGAWLSPRCRSSGSP